MEKTEQPYDFFLLVSGAFAAYPDLSCFDCAFPRCDLLLAELACFYC